MAKSKQTFNKKEKEKKKLKKRQDKAERKEERKENSSKGQSFEDMLAYVDEFGNLSSVPPDPEKKKRILEQEIINIGVERSEDDNSEESVNKGIVTFYNTSKSFGFIKVLGSTESIFVHARGLVDPIKQNDRVSFDIERTPKGLSAINVKVIK